AKYFIGSGYYLTDLPPTSPIWDISGNDIYYDSGNVGIGTGDLTVSGGKVTLTNSIFNDNLSASYLQINPQNNMVAIYDGSDSQTVRIFHGGSHGLDLIGSQTLSKVQTLGAGNDLLIDASGGDIQIGSGDNLNLNGDLFIDNSTGHVGIGKVAHTTYDLDVAGTSNFGGNVYIGGSLTVNTGKDVCITGGNCLSDAGSGEWTPDTYGITYADNVGIGKASVTGTKALDVAGDINLGNQALSTAGTLNRGYYVYGGGGSTISYG
ncbi:unnamed protein product, partial [marine sediment metagenome]